MAIIWTPPLINLGVLKENQDFTYTITAVSESQQENSPPTNLRVTVKFIGDEPDNLIIGSSGLSAVVSGNTGFHFDDKLHLLTKNYTYQFLSNLTGERGKSVWNKADDTNTRQVVGFYPDVNRYKEFNLVATAHSPFGSTVIDTKNYKIVIFDPNWDNGKNKLRLFLDKIKNNDSNSN